MTPFHIKEGFHDFNRKKEGEESLTEHFTIAEPQNPMILRYSDTGIDGFWGADIVKGLVGKRIPPTLA